MITPPVPESVLAEVASDPKSLENVAEDLSMLQRIVKADKSSIVAAVVHAAVPLTASFNLHLNGHDIAILSAIVSTGLTYFVGLNFRTKSKLAK